DILERMPPSCSTPELFIPVAEPDKFALIEQLVQELRFASGNMNYLDGIRVDFANGWGLIRASNTTPNLVLRFEADSAEDLAAIQREFRAGLLAILPWLELPF
ncbi:MAG: phosphomannomutase/phosphoglucomutase, partial [Pseudomonadota bacterium]|nr:phosphomannomutase/phosphoglucomutase [Pseudomonadota bacterium]